MKELGRFCATAGLAMLVLAACAADRATKPDPSNDAPREVTPLHEAARDGHAGIVRALLADGAEVDARAEGEATPLHLAATLGHTATSRALIEGGANVNARAEGKATPLHYAALLGNAGAIEALLEAGGNPNAVAFGCGPMDVARLRMKATERSIAPFREAVEHLRAAGAQPRKGCKLR